MILSHVMTREVHTISSEKSVKTAGIKMDEHRVGSLVVVEQDQVIGIITSRNVRSSHPNRIVADAMTTELVWVAPDLSIFDAIQIMQEKEIERLIVMEEQRLAGIVTRETVVASVSLLLDPLTRLYRAPYIEHVTTRLLAQRQPFWFLFLDLNDFGRINKEYGHHIGDQLLVHFCTYLRSVTEESDSLCRYAGDEFAIVTTRSQNHAKHLAERLSQPLMYQDIPYQVAVGLYPDSVDASPFDLSFADILNKTSLITTMKKKLSSIPIPRS